MAEFAIDPTTGEVDDRVRLVLGGDNIRTFEDYEVRVSVLTQPAQFSTRLSAGGGTAELIAKYPPRTPFVLQVGGLPQFTGETDGFVTAGTGAGTTVTFRGRDLLARLHDNDVAAERSFTSYTLEQVVIEALKANGLDDRIVQVSNAAHREVKSGIRVPALGEPVTPAHVRRSVRDGGVRHVMTCRLGESWLNFVERQLMKEGLKIWTDFEGNFVVAQPNGNQRPTFHFVRQRGQLRNVCNVREATFTNDTTRRFSEVVIFARNLGRKFGRNHTHGSFVDEEMVALGYDRKRVYRDASVVTEGQAEFYARQKIAEVNRAAWKLEYTFSGHTGPSVVGGRAVLTPDLVAKVDDDELGIHEDMYIESVVYRSPPRTTTVTLMRLRDLVFGEAPAQASAPQRRANARQMTSFTRNRNPTSFTRG